MEVCTYILEVWDYTVPYLVLYFSIEKTDIKKQFIVNRSTSYIFISSRQNRETGINEGIKSQNVKRHMKKKNLSVAAM